MATKAITIGGNGQRLAKLLIAAAGVDAPFHHIRSITCKCDRNAVVVFEVEMIGNEEQVGKALDAIDPVVLAEIEQRKQIIAERVSRRNEDELPAQQRIDQQLREAFNG